MKLAIWLFDLETWSLETHHPHATCLLQWGLVWLDLFSGYLSRPLQWLFLLKKCTLFLLYTSMENLCNSYIKNCTVYLSERASSHEVRALKAQEREERAMFDPVSELGLNLTRFSIPSLTHTVNFSILNTKILPARVSHLVSETYRRRGLVERINFDELNINCDWPKCCHFLPATGFYPNFF